jgi:hypothetical protein
MLQGLSSFGTVIPLPVISLMILIPVFIQLITILPYIIAVSSFASFLLAILFWQCYSDFPFRGPAATILYRLELQGCSGANAKQVTHCFLRDVYDRSRKENLDVLRE